MQTWILLSCIFAVTSAIYSPYITHQGHLPVDTPEVQAAKQQHFAAKYHALGGQAYAPNHYGVDHMGLPLDTPEVAAAKVQHYHDYAAAAQRNGVAVHGLPVHYGGIYPIDTHDVQIAKIAHFKAHAEARARNGHGHFRRRRSLYAQHIPVIDHNGVPVETPEVQAAKAHHFQALAEASSRSGPVGYHGDYSAGYSSPYAHTYPQLAHDGQPIETPEVQAAKAHHFAAHAEAAHRGPYSSGPYGGSYHDESPTARYHGPLAVLGPHGVPVETPEVQHAKAEHLNALAAAGGRAHYY